jgi:DNA-binding response OmpR family regulator
VMDVASPLAASVTDAMAGPAAAPSPTAVPTIRAISLRCIVGEDNPRPGMHRAGAAQCMSYLTSGSQPVHRMATKTPEPDAPVNWNMMAIDRTTQLGATPASADASLNILVVDDESDLREMLNRSFSREGHRVTAVADGRAAIDRASTEPYDIILLDVALGAGPDGYEVCRTLRSRRNVVPIIMLTALDSEADAVLGLEAGGDDYVTKPFGLAELRSRIRAVLRRAGTRAIGAELLSVGPISLDRSQREVSVEGEPVKLTFSEFELLDALMTEPGRLLNRQELLRAIWGDSAYRDPRAIDVHIRHLREKLEPEPEKPKYILTVRGAGYRLRGS